MQFVCGRKNTWGETATTIGRISKSDVDNSHTHTHTHTHALHSELSSYYAISVVVPDKVYNVATPGNVCV